MLALPKVVKSSWKDRQGPFVFATSDSDGNPNVIYVTCVNRYSDDTIVIADNKFFKTRENIKAGSRGSLLFVTGEKKAYQIKGGLEYYVSGEYYDDMKRWLDPKYPGNAACVLRVEEVYCGSEKLSD
ncbi:MAG: pyridoxamine 5'-phosphate oxidase family protein [Spirochaetes bacterium]|nr:pyridoxamine 5'-phosphate oxidase family protein [Spirochaetota bacterium]